MSAYAKCACQHCATHLEFPLELAGQSIECPACSQTTLLPNADPEAPIEPEPPPKLNAAELLSQFSGPVPPTRTSLIYQIGLAIVAFTMLLLPLLYIGLIGAAVWGVSKWAACGKFLFTSGHGGGRAMVFRAILYIAPLFAGAVLVVFMIKPIFARRAKAAQPLALNPGAEPLLFAFIAKVCEAIGAPAPKRIDLDCNLNAAAGFRRGFFSFFSNDLVLTIGMPLVAGLSVTQLGGVIAHEFGHFAQGFGMRLTYIIRSVNEWFARVVYERDAWDESLEGLAQVEDGRLAIVIGCARLAVWFSRLVLMLLMYTGHAIGCFMLRQMEFDADSYEIKLAGSETFEATTRRMHVLAAALKPAYEKMQAGFQTKKELPQDFPAFLMRIDAELRPEQRTRIEDTLGLHKSGLFDTHPSPGDRIRAARVAGEPGLIQCDRSARELFENFDVPAKHVTMLHYTDDLDLPAGVARLVPVQPAK